VVWEGWDRVERRSVAVKVLRDDTDPATRARFAVEAGVRIDHPHVAAARDASESGSPGTPWLVTELLRGGTVRDLAARTGRVPPAYAAQIAEQLLDALSAVHAAGVVHRDVKPANLLLAATGSGRPHVELADFGVAVHLGQAWDQSCEQAGTPGYLAPESLAGAAPHPAQDIWAAGLVIRQLHDEPGPLTTLTCAMSRADPAARPSAAAGLARVRTMPRPRAEWWPTVRDSIDQVTGR
jgi:serine/threonine protein kinase